MIEHATADHFADVDRVVFFYGAVASSSSHGGRTYCFFQRTEAG